MAIRKNLEAGRARQGEVMPEAALENVDVFLRWSGKAQLDIAARLSIFTLPPAFSHRNVVAIGP